MFKLGDRVYPKEIEIEDCEANKTEMQYLVGFVCEVNKGCGRRQYSVNWVDERDGEEAEFDHGLKNSWYEDSELTKDKEEYLEMLEDQMDDGEYCLPSNEELDGDAEIFAHDILNDSLDVYSTNYWDGDDDDAEDIREEYRCALLRRVIKLLENEIE